MCFNNLNKCLKMVFACLIFKPRGWFISYEHGLCCSTQFALLAGSLLSLCNVLGCWTDVPRAQVSPTPCGWSQDEHAGREVRLEQRCSADASAVRVMKGHQWTKLRRNHILPQVSYWVDLFIGTVLHRWITLIHKGTVTDWDKISFPWVHTILSEDI